MQSSSEAILLGSIEQFVRLEAVLRAEVLAHEMTQQLLELEQQRRYHAELQLQQRDEQISRLESTLKARYKDWEQERNNLCLNIPRSSESICSDFKVKGVQLDPDRPESYKTQKRSLKHGTIDQSSHGIMKKSGGMI